MYITVVMNGGATTIGFGLVGTPWIRPAPATAAVGVVLCGRGLGRVGCRSYAERSVGGIFPPGFGTGIDEDTNGVTCVQSFVSCVQSDEAVRLDFTRSNPDPDLGAEHFCRAQGRG